MCGIAGLFSKSLDVSEQPREPSRGHAPPAERPWPRQRRRRDLPRPRAERLVQGVAVQPRSAAGLGRGARRARRGVRRRRAGAARLACRDRRGDRRGRGAGLAARALSGAARDERRSGDRDLQGDGPAAGVRRDVRARQHVGHARAGPHADGHREPRHHRALAPVLHRARPVPRAQRLAVEPQPAAPAAARRGHRVRDRQRHRGGGGLPDLAAARGRLARAGARGLPRGPRRLLHVRGRHDRRLRGAARPDRVQAGGDGRDRRLGRDGVRVPRDRRAAGRRERAHVGARARARVQLGAARPSDELSRAASRPRSSTSRSRPCAS